MFRVIIAGSRGFQDYALLVEKADKILAGKRRQGEMIAIVSGGARGADRLGEQYAQERQFQLQVFPANWDLYGKRAGYLRNEEMARNAEALIAFWDGQSRGARHMIEIAQQQGLQVRVVRF